jgi:hypothetical protein
MEGVCGTGLASLERLFYLMAGAESGPCSMGMLVHKQVTMGRGDIRAAAAQLKYLTDTGDMDLCARLAHCDGR